MKFWKLASAIFFLILATSSNAAMLHSSTWDAQFSPTYSNVRGNPEVVGPTETFSTRSLAFNTSGNTNLCCYYDQITYEIGSENSPYKAFNISFDIYTDSLIGSNNQFTILFDTPTVRNLIFTNEGNIELHPGWDSQQLLTTYNENESMHIDMMFDIGSNIWDVSLNDIVIYSSYIDNVSNPYLQPAEYLRSIRFSQGLESSLNSPSHNATVYLDNVMISSVPVPAAVWLFGSGLIGLAGIARRKKS